MNTSELQLRATRQARAGLTAQETFIWDDDAALQMPYAFQDLAENVQCDDHKRSLLTKRFDLEFVGGKALLGETAKRLHRASLKFSRFYGWEDAEERSPYVYQSNWQDMQGHRNPRRGYYALRGDEMLAIEAFADTQGAPFSANFGGIAHLYAVAIPAVESDVIDIPAELETDLVTALADRLKLMASERVKAIGA